MRGVQKTVLSSRAQWAIIGLEGRRKSKQGSVTHLAQKDLSPGAIFVESHEPEETAAGRDKRILLTIRECHCPIFPQPEAPWRTQPAERLDNHAADTGGKLFWGLPGKRR